MKPTLLFTTLTLILAMSPTFAKSELETLRSLCAEQERQIRQLEDENMKLRDGHEVPTAGIHNSLKASPPQTNTIASIPAVSAVSESAYIVKPGDSIDKIARKVGTSATKLAKTNGLKTSSIIHPGQKLKVPGMSPKTSIPATGAVIAATPPVRETGGKTHTVRQGETFFSIAKKHGVSTTTLVAANPTVKASALRPGQVLHLGGSGSTAAMISTPVSQVKTSAPTTAAKLPDVSPSASSSRPTTIAHTIPSGSKAAPALVPAPVVESAPANATASAAPANKFRSITIEGEMTYGDFAAKHGTDAERLNALNGLDLTTATVLAKGSELYVPARP